MEGARQQPSGGGWKWGWNFPGSWLVLSLRCYHQSCLGVESAFLFNVPTLSYESSPICPLPASFQPYLLLISHPEKLSISGPLEMLEMCFVILKEQWPDRAHVLPRGAREAKTEVGKSSWVKDATCSFPGVTKLRLKWGTCLWWGKGCSLSLAIAIPLKAIRGLGTLFFTQTKLELASPRMNGDGSGCLVNKTYKWCCMN